MSGVAIIGLGSVLMGDDGFGPYVVRLFGARYDCGPDVAVLDLGTPGLDLAPHIEGLDALIVVDTVVSEGPAAALRLYRKGDLLSKPALPRTNPHQPGVKETLLRLEVDGAAPAEVLLVGAIPAVVETVIGLSPALRVAAEDAIAEVARELDRLGHAPAERGVAEDPDIWWERPASGAAAERPRREA